MSKPVQQPQSTPCPKCAGERVLADCAEYLRVRPVGKPLSFQTSTFFALVCTTCGYTEFYARHPERLSPSQPEGRKEQAES